MEKKKKKKGKKGKNGRKGKKETHTHAHAHARALATIYTNVLCLLQRGISSRGDPREFALFPYRGVVRRELHVPNFVGTVLGDLSIVHGGEREMEGFYLVLNG